MSKIMILVFGLEVALRKESVDRNDGHMHQGQHFVDVALRKESVDRNHDSFAAPFY